jgi:copper transport protein
MRIAPVRRLMALVCLLAFAGCTGTAFAHAQLLSASPAANAVVEAAPDGVKLLFNEPVTAVSAGLFAPDGSRQDLLPQTSSGTAVMVRLPKGLGQGTHVLSWRVVSSDGHPIGSSLVFSVGQATGDVQVDSGDPAVPRLLWGGKLVLFIALFGGVGGLWFGAFAPLPPLARRIALALLPVGGGAAAATLCLQGLDALGLPVASGLEGGVWAAGLATSYGFTAMVAGVAFVVAAAVLEIREGRDAAIVVSAAATFAALSLALSGHASAAEPQWLARPAVFLHVGGVLFWVGALLPLSIHLTSRSPDADLALARFSRIIPFAVAPLVISGLTLAIIQLGPIGADWLSPYGFILLAKLVLLAGLFSLALWNRVSLTRPALAGQATARRRLTLSVRAEIVVVLVILGLVAGWRFTPPPRSLADVEAASLSEPILLHLQEGNDMGMITITPGRSGQVAVRIELTDIANVETPAKAVSVIVSAPEAGIEPIKTEATRIRGAWSVDALALPLPGAWQIELNVRKSDFELKKLAGNFELAR